MLMPMPPDNGAGAAAAGKAASEAGQDYGEVLWTPGPDRAERSVIGGYQRWLAAEREVATDSYAALWQWSVSDPAAFWNSIWDFFGVVGVRGAGPVLTGEQMPRISWFEGSTLNYAENILRWAATSPDKTAVVYRSEAGRDGTLSYAELDREVARVAAGLAELGVGPGDRVAAYLPNSPEALIALLATASLGAIWTSCSPDFGPHSVIDRFAQVAPKVLIAVDGYVYGGKRFDRRAEVAAIAAELPGLAALVQVSYVGAHDTGPDMPVRVVAWTGLPGGAEQAGPATCRRVPFMSPLWVLYSSGTTGLPKPIVHSHGGIVLEHLKALSLHQDLTAADTFFWYTTTGWMMWNYLVGGLLLGATVVLYDGSATISGTGQAETGALWRLAAETGVSYAGTGAPYLLACMKEGLRPAAEYDLTAIRGVGSTGSPLPPEGFRWVYEQLARPGQDLLLGSFSGGTDLCTGFVGPNPLLPDRAGIIAGACLGAKVESFDADGQPVIGEVGELVLTEPMPSMPVGFWHDEADARYLASYFAEYPGVWRHGDWIMILPDGGCVIYGRSDATLNRGGIRMGTSEFYRVVERLPEVADSLVVDTGKLGQEGRLILYVVPAEGHVVDDELIGKLRAMLRSELSPRHVPDEIHQVPGIPRTLSGKKLEVPVRKILLGTPVAEAADPDALANPEVLGSFVPGAAS